MFYYLCWISDRISNSFFPLKVSYRSRKLFRWTCTKDFILLMSPDSPTHPETPGGSISRNAVPIGRKKSRHSGQAYELKKIAWYSKILLLFWPHLLQRIISLSVFQFNILIFCSLVLNATLSVELKYCIYCIIKIWKYEMLNRLNIH